MDGVGERLLFIVCEPFILFYFSFKKSSKFSEWGA
jgi:hypothetical protein